MASDLARTPNSGLRAQLCGDAHLSNFGVFGSPERTLVFDINDFDETAPGPWEWDVKRLAASFVVGGRENGFSESGATHGRAHHRPRLPGGDPPPRKRCAISNSGTRSCRSRRPSRSSRPALPQACCERRKPPSRSRGRRTACKPSKADSPRRWGAPNHQRPAAGRAGRRAPPDEVATGPSSTDHIRTLIRTYRRTLETDRRHLLEQFRYVDWPAKSSASAASAPAPGLRSSSASTARTRSFYRSKRHSRRYSNSSSGRANTATAANASSPANG